MQLRDAKPVDEIKMYLDARYISTSEAIWRIFHYKMHIGLTPKSADVRKYAATIDLWIPDGQANPIREKLTEPSKDYLLETYSNLKINPPLPDSAFRLNLPPGVKELRP
jgi:outer membrane lipoprotein-sorting protein